MENTYYLNPDGIYISNNYIVGNRFHTGHVTGGDLVLLEREPNNQFDCNAIVAKLINKPHETIGYIPAASAIKLATLLDRNIYTIVKTRVSPEFDYNIMPDNTAIPIQITFELTNK